MTPLTPSRLTQMIEAAIWAHYERSPSPCYAIGHIMREESFDDFLSVYRPFIWLFLFRMGWTVDNAVLALLFAAEAVEGDE